MKALSTRNDAPERASRPFDNDRDGILLFPKARVSSFSKSLKHASRGEQRSMVKLPVMGYNGDAYHITAPSPDERRGLSACINMALKDAGFILR